MSDLKDARKKVIFLYYELMGYTLAGLRALLETSRDFDLFVVSRDKGNLTPYTFEALPGMNYKRFSEFAGEHELLAYCKDIQPDALFVNSWRAAGSEYMTVARYFTSQAIPTICMFDNQWLGTLKQRLAVWTAPFFLHKYFTHMWGCGDRQAAFARRLGYPSHKIFSGFYTCDAALYQAIPAERRHKERAILFVGRFVKDKGIDLLVSVFGELAGEFPDWSLKLVGSGALDWIGPMPENSRIYIEKFRQPEALAEAFAEASVFCLPSIFEPWGVVIHEAAMAALPVVVSDACGAGDAFVAEGSNGFKFRSGDRDALKDALQKIMAATDEERAVMGKASRLLAEHNTPEKWAGKFREILYLTTDDRHPGKI